MTGKARRRPGRRKLFFRDLVGPALEAKRLRGSSEASLAKDEQRLGRLLMLIGSIPAREITPGIIERALEALARGDHACGPLKGSTTVTVTAHGFTATGNMETARELHTATLLGNGKVLLVGGNDSTGKALASAELFDPATGTFAPTKGNMESARVDHTATLLKDGTVLVTGGPGLATAELFDPATGTFTPTRGNMETARENHTATLLNDGTVLVTGGAGLSSAELFDPATGTFTPTKGSMETARGGHTATLLNGEVPPAASASSP